MPGMSGWQVAEAIATRSTTPVILITGSAAAEDTERARAQGMILLHKPLHLANLKGAVEQLLQRRHDAVS
jgi:CheY-like chemotaxis protein